MTRHFWVLVHRYAGLYMAFFLIVAGLTGSILAFDAEIHDWLNPPVKVALRAEPQLDELTLRERALALAPHGQINHLRLQREPDKAYVARIEPRTDPASGQPYALTFNKLVLDPYTGAELARENEPEKGLWPITRKNFIHVIVRLHYQLALPGWIGTWLFGIAALLWTIDCFVGAYLTFPRRLRRRAGGEGDAAQSARKAWWMRWKPAWLVKWSGSAYRINFDLHRAGGLWVWLLLLVLAWSSVGLNLPEQIYTPVMKAVFNMPDLGLPTLATPQREPGLSWREAHRIGQRLMAEQAGIHGFRVQREEWLEYFAESGLFFYIVHSDRDVVDEQGGTYVVFNGNSGQFAGLELPSGLNAGSTLNQWIFALHLALLWGVPYKVFLCGVGILIAVLSVTGVIIWWRKRRSGKYRTARLAAGVTDRFTRVQ
ncbi:MAG: PepSY domain-containing protein [Acidobacteria bacterium]|nr:PepSY domain-containing protein [Acidobacteriota bacterium]